MNSVLKVLQATAWYPPRNMGGTEIYVTSLVAGLRSQGIDSGVLVPVSETVPQDYEFHGVHVREYAVEPLPGSDQFTGAVTRPDFERFRKLLEEGNPDIYHQHSWTRGLGPLHLRAARELGLHTVLTVHLPDVFCMRGTMMHFGCEPCENKIDEIVCVACASEGRGAPLPVAHAVARSPASLSRLIKRVVPDSRLATAFSGREEARLRKRQFEEMVANTDRIVAVSDWVRQALLRNGAPAEKVILCRQGVDDGVACAVRDCNAVRHAGPLRLGYLGRWHPTKGVDVLIRAVRALPPEMPVELVIHGIPADDNGRAFEAEQITLASRDRRIVVRPPASRAEIPTVLKSIDAIAVPSLCLETGPLIVLEAQSAGLAILGSAIGGIAELTGTGEPNQLLPPGDTASWSRAIGIMANNVDKLRALRAPRRVRTMSEAATDIALIYRSMLGSRRQTGKR